MTRVLFALVSSHSKTGARMLNFLAHPSEREVFLGPTTIKLLLVTKTILHAYYTLSEENLVKARKELQKHESCNSILNITINPI